MLLALAPLAWASAPDPVPLPNLRDRPFDGNAQGAHRVAVVGRGMAIGGSVVAVGTFLPSLACSFGGPAGLCITSFVATTGGVVTALVGVGVEGVGSAIFLDRSRRAGRGPGPALGLGLVVTGAIVTAVGGPIRPIGALAVLGGVITMDVQHELARRKPRPRAPLVVHPVIDPARRWVGVAGRF